MFLKTKWFRLIVTLALSVTFIILGICLMGAETVGFIDELSSYGLKGLMFSDGKFEFGLTMIVFAVGYFLCFLARDLMGIDDSDPPEGLRKLIFISGVVLITVAAILSTCFSINYSNVQSKTADFKITTAKAFSVALFTVPFALVYVLGDFLHILFSKNGETVMLAFARPIGLVVGYLIAFVLAAFCGPFYVYIQAVLTVLGVVYVIFVNFGMGARIGSGSSVSSKADKAVANAAKSVARSFKERTLVASCGVHVYIQPRVSVGESQVTYYMDYYLTGLDTVKTDSDASTVQKNLNYEINNCGNRLLNKAVTEIKNANPSAGYSVNVVSGRNLKG